MPNGQLVDVLRLTIDNIAERPWNLQVEIEMLQERM